MTNVTLITGDGIGPEIAHATRRCVDVTGAGDTVTGVFALALAAGTGAAGAAGRLRADARAGRWAGAGGGTALDRRAATRLALRGHGLVNLLVAGRLRGGAGAPAEQRHRDDRDGREARNDPTMRHGRFLSCCRRARCVGRALCRIPTGRSNTKPGAGALAFWGRCLTPAGSEGSGRGA